MIEDRITRAMWKVLHDRVSEQRNGMSVTAEQVGVELEGFLRDNDITLPAMFQGLIPFELIALTVEAGVLLVTTSYPDSSPAQFIHPLFVECGSRIPRREEWDESLAKALEEKFCPPAADAAEKEETAPAAGIRDPERGRMQQIEMSDGSQTATAWISTHMAIEGTTFPLGDDDEVWQVTLVWPFILDDEQMRRLPPGN